MPVIYFHIFFYTNYFFTTAVTQTQNDVVKKMDEAITKYIEKAWKNGK